MSMLLSPKWNRWNRFHRFSIPHSILSSLSSSTPACLVVSLSRPRSIMSLNVDVSFSSSLSASNSDNDFDVDASPQHHIDDSKQHRPKSVTTTTTRTAAVTKTNMVEQKSNMMCDTQSTTASSYTTTTTTATATTTIHETTPTIRCAEGASPSCTKTRMLLGVETAVSPSTNDKTVGMLNIINISLLPPDVFDVIATYTSLNDLLGLAQTCKYMHEMVGNLQRPCHDCGENIFGNSVVGKPMECLECGGKNGGPAVYYCSDCHVHCDICAEPCCIHRYCTHCDAVACADCSADEPMLQTCEGCGDDICHECAMTCSVCGDVYGPGDCCVMPFHPSCPCCELPVCAPCDMMRTVMVRVGPRSVMLVRLVPHDEDDEDDDDFYNDDDDEYGYDDSDDDDDDIDDDDDDDDDDAGNDDLLETADISVLRSNPFFALSEDYDRVDPY